VSRPSCSSAAIRLKVLRPALADKQGRTLFIGTPRGYDHLYDLYQAVQGQSQWSTFQFTTEEGGNVPKAELESATHELDERTYRQEFQASFEPRTGSPYSDTINVRVVRSEHHRDHKQEGWQGGLVSKVYGFGRRKDRHRRVYPKPRRQR